MAETGTLSGRIVLVTGAGRGIGRAAAFLLSEAAANITGQTLYVDGGLTAQLHPRLPE